MRYRVGVIGLGVGMAHLEAFRALADCSVVAVCDFSEEKRAAVASRFPEVRIARTEQELLDSDLDIVCIASYDSHHARQVLSALEKGHHVFAEKPLCTSQADAQLIVTKLKSSRELRLGTNLILRRSPLFAWLRREIESGTLGEVYSIETGYYYGRLHKLTEGWRGQEPHYSPTLGGGIHLIDLLSWLTGQRVERVAAFANGICSRGSQYKGNDLVTATLQYRSGMIATLSSNFGCVHPHSHRMRVFGTKATFTLEPDSCGGHQALLFSGRERAPKIISREYPGVGKGDLIPQFVRALGGEPLEVSYEEIFHGLAVAFAIDHAAETASSTTVQSMW